MSGNPNLNFDINKIENIDIIFKDQLNSFQKLRNMIKDLPIIPIQPTGLYKTISYKSIDGGMMGIQFEPFDLDLVEIADSNGDHRMKFLVPVNENLEKHHFAFMDEIQEIKKFRELLNEYSILNCVNFLSTTQNAMDLAEWACIMNNLAKDKDDELLIMKDGLLRTKTFMPHIKQKILSILKNHPRRRLVGVAKQSKVLNLISTALMLEKKFKYDEIGFIEIPEEIEKLAYKYKVNVDQFAFGKLYVAKLSPRSNLLVTIEIPFNKEENEPIYSTNVLREIMGHLAKDSKVSYPTIGYPQTIMVAHEKAVLTGFTASIWREKIIEAIVVQIKDPEFQNLIRDSYLIRQAIDRSNLGGV